MSRTSVRVLLAAILVTGALASGVHAQELAREQRIRIGITVADINGLDPTFATPGGTDIVR